MMIDRIGDSTKVGTTYAINGAIQFAGTPGADPMITTKETAKIMTITKTTTAEILIVDIQTSMTTMVTAARQIARTLMDQDMVTVTDVKMNMADTTAMNNIMAGIFIAQNRSTSRKIRCRTKLKF